MIVSTHCCHVTYFDLQVQMKRRSPVKFVDSRGDLVLCITLEVEAHVSETVSFPVRH